MNHCRSLDQPLLPTLIVVDKLDGLADDGPTVGRKLLAPDRRMLADPIPVALEVEIELTVGIAQGVGIDASAEVGLADQRLWRRVDERSERVRGNRDTDALHVL